MYLILNLFILTLKYFNHLLYWETKKILILYTKGLDEIKKNHLY